MHNITDDLRRYRDLRPVYDLYTQRVFQEIFAESVDETLPRNDDPRIVELYEIEDRISNLAVESPSLVIEDSSLFQLFGRLQKTSADNTLDKHGSIIPDDLYDKLYWEYHPEYFVKRMLQARPLTTLIEVPQDVIDLLTEARKAYCLRLSTACISVCRSTVERAVLDIAVRIGRIKKSDAPEELRMCAKISALIDADLSSQSPLRREIDCFMADTSRIVHSSVKAAEPEALRLYLQALDLIQQLYGRYRIQLTH